MKRLLISLAVALGLVAQPALATDRKPLVIISGQTQQIPTGDTVPVANGGTGATTASAARSGLGLGTLATQNAPTGSNQCLQADSSGNVSGTGSVCGTGGGGGGGVTSVDVSGGSTGLTTSGGPVTASGTITLAGTVDVDNGGTGQTSYTNGQLLIGNTTGNTLAKSTLTAGSNITITNGAGSITIASTGGANPGWSTAPTPPRAADFTKTDGTSVTSTLTDTTRGVILSSVGTNAERVTLLEKTPPGSTWVMTVAISQAFNWRNYMGFGLYAKDSAGKIHVCSIQYDSGNGSLKRRDMRLTNINTFSSQITGSDWVGTHITWLRMTANSTNFICENAIDGETWSNPYTVSKTAFLGSTISNVGIFFNANVQSSAQTEYIHIMAFTLQ